MTPVKKLISCGIYNADRLLDFPTMILEDDIYELMKCTNIIKFVTQVNQDRKSNKKGIGKYD